MCKCRIPYVENVSIPLLANTKTYKLNGLSENLKDRDILGLFVRYQTGNLTDKDGVALASNDVVGASFLTLHKAGKDIYDDYPLGHAIHTHTNSQDYTCLVAAGGIDLSKSFVNIAIAPKDNTVLEIVFITEASADCQT